MTTEELQTKIIVSKEKVAKIENLIKKYTAQRVKKIEALNKILSNNNVKKTYDDVKDKKAWVYDYQDKDFYLELYWTYCDVVRLDELIKDNQNKLKDANSTVEKWEQKLRQEKARLQYIQDAVPEIIKQFLEDWKTAVIKYYTKKSETYEADLKEFRVNKEQAYFDALKETVERLIGEDRDEFLRKYCRDSDSRLQHIQEMLESYNPNNASEYHNLIYFSYRDSNKIEEHPRYVRVLEQWNNKYGDSFFQAWKNASFDPDWLDKKIEEEKKAKIIDLMTKVSKITGVITNATNLHLENGDINGIIIGEDGKARIQTIGAGGWNIQRAHLRVLVHEIKE